VQGIVERLRSFDRTYGLPERRARLDACAEAASLISSLSAENGKLKGALKPFADASERWCAEHMSFAPDDIPVEVIVNTDLGHLRRARSLTNDRDGGTHE
jgi:hypothetical protein